MTEGYVFDMNGRGGRTKNTSWIEWIVANMDRFRDRSFVMTALETHDERRLTQDTGFNPLTGAGFWGIGATTWSLPMLLVGQELGESFGLGFRRSDFLRARFEGSSTFYADHQALQEFYRQMIWARRDQANRALGSQGKAFLRPAGATAPDEKIFAQVKWSGDGSVVFTAHNLWEQHTAQTYAIPDELATSLGIANERAYRLVDALSGQLAVPCREGRSLRTALPLSFAPAERLRWLRLEACP